MQNNPFKALKGFSASAPDKPEPKGPVTPAPAAGEEPASFSEEMSRLGVRPLAKPQRPEEPTPAAETAETALPASDEELFIAELGKLDIQFADRFPGDEEPVAAAPRRMRLLRQGKLVPEATVDLHGLTRDEAREKVRFFLENAVYHCRSTVLIVTGWGRGSAGEPVLRAEMEQFLAGEGRTWVAEWGRAPKSLGGEGALVAFLRATDKIHRPGE
jgi:DNA-nicking Smr family endonuclease